MSAVLESLPASPVAAARAEMMAHDLAETALQIADAPVPMVEGRTDPGAVHAKRLQGELCMWLASQIYPRVYGDQVSAEVGGPEGGPVPIAPSPMDTACPSER